MTKLIKDLSILTTIPERAIERLFDKSYYIISDSVEEALLEDRDIVEIDIEIGKIWIQIIDTSIKYKFIPSRSLENCLKKTVVNKQNMLKETLESNISSKILNTYKDFL